MIRIIRLLRIFFASAIFIPLSLIINILLINKGLRLKILSSLNRDFAASIRHILGIKVNIQGNMPMKNVTGSFIISNHLSYIDGFVLGSIFKVIYISKKQVRSWPFFGIIARLGATVFIDRSRKDLSIFYVGEIKNLLSSGINILLFPEGTSTNGRQLLPFQPIFFSSPIQAKAEILPVNIFYTHLNGRNIAKEEKDKLHWYGQVPFHRHLWQVLSIKSMGVKLVIHNKIKAAEYENNALARHSLALRAHDTISSKYPKTNT